MNAPFQSHAILKFSKFETHLQSNGGRFGDAFNETSIERTLSLDESSTKSVDFGKVPIKRTRTFPNRHPLTEQSVSH